MHSLRFPPIDPIAFQLGPIAVHWYGIAYAIGFILGYLALRRLIHRGFLRVTTEALGDLVIWLVAGVIVGGRAGWWVVYHRSKDAPEPWYEALAVWHGGMSFHGGLVGVGIALTLWSRMRQAPLWNVADAVALVAPIGLFFGRLANFVNAELVGRATEAPWGIVFPGDSIARHPSQIYEAALEGPILFSCLRVLARNRVHRDGEFAAMFLILYGLFRMVVEFFREPDKEIGIIAFGWLTMGQALSLVIAAIGVALLIWRHIVGEPNATVVHSTR